MNDSLLAEWSKWNSVHDSDDQKKRVESAKLAKCTPIVFDPENGYAYYEGSLGKYETFLDRCSCPDFLRRHLPCKHMYRLAMELNLIEGPFLSYMHGGYPWKQAVELIEKYPEDVQRVFYDHFYTSRKSAAPYRKKKSPKMDILINDGYLIEYPDKETAKFKTVHLIEDFMVNPQKLNMYFSRKLYPPEYFNGYEMVPDDLPEDDVTAFLRERGFVK